MITKAQKTPAELRRELRELRKHLADLVGACESVLSHLDAEMKKPSSPERGRRVAEICNHLELHKDMAKRFGLKIVK